MNSIVQVRQISQYPDADPVFPDDRVVLQRGGLGGPYRSATVADLVATALMLPAEDGTTLDLELAPGQGLNWEGFPDARFWFGAINDDRFFFGREVVVPGLSSAGQITINGRMVATIEDLNAYLPVRSFNGRVGDVVLSEDDVKRAGAAPIWNAHFGGHITAPTPWDTRLCDDTVATTAWVHRAIHDTAVVSFNGRTGCVTLTVCDINAAYASAPPGVYPTAPTPALGDASNRIATTLFVDESLADLEQRIPGIVGTVDLSGYAPLNSPNFTGIPLAPTANPGTSTGQLATTAFVHAAVTAATAGVASFNGRTGSVTLSISDVTGAGGAPAASPNLTGTPLAPTASPGTSTQQIATTAFVQAAIGAIGSGVVSFNGRTGAVTLVTADVTGAGGAPISGPTFTGTVRAPTPAPATNDTTVATTAYVTAALSASVAGVASFNSRTGAVTLLNADISAAGGALIASPAFTGTPAAPTAPTNTNTTQLATTAFVMAQIAASTGAGVTSFNTRTGVVTLVLADVTGAGGAPIVSPAFTGTPTAPTAVGTSNDTTIATTAFVKAAIASAGGVTSFNSRTGAVTLASGDISAAGGALVASPAFSGTPTAPTAVPGDSSTQLATTAFVSAAITAGAVASFNGRNGAVTLNSADVTGAGGALLASPSFTGTPLAPTQAPGTNNTTLATTAFVQAAVSAAGGVTSVTAGAGLTGGGTGAVTLSIPNAGVSFSMIGNFPTQTLLGRSGAGSGPGSAQTVTQVMTMLGAAPLASPTFTGTVTIPAGASIAGYLPLAGGTLTGNLGLGGANPTFVLNKPASGQSATLAGQTAGLTRWLLFLGDSVAEGSNAGSNFVISRYNDTAVFVDNPISISRASGVATFSQAIVNGPSDRRLKENIVPIEDALGKIGNLSGVSFNMISSPQKREIGLVAQEVMTVVPEVIQDFRGADGESFLALDYSRLVALLIEAVKTLAERVRALEA